MGSGAWVTRRMEKTEVEGVMLTSYVEYVSGGRCVRVLCR